MQNYCTTRKRLIATKEAEMKPLSSRVPNFPLPFLAIHPRRPEESGLRKFM